MEVCRPCLNLFSDHAQKLFGYQDLITGANARLLTVLCQSVGYEPFAGDDDEKEAKEATV